MNQGEGSYMCLLLELARDMHVHFISYVLYVYNRLYQVVRVYVVVVVV